METVIVLLSENLDLLKAELEQEENQFKKFNERKEQIKEKRQLSMESQAKNSQEKTKFPKTTETEEYYSEPREIAIKAEEGEMEYQNSQQIAQILQPTTPPFNNN